MFKIIKKGLVIVHKCVQCGLTTAYEEDSNRLCEHCKAAQRMRADNGKTSGPVCFMLDGGAVWREIYHNKETNLL